MNRVPRPGESGRPPSGSPEPAEPHFAVAERHGFRWKRLAKRVALAGTGTVLVVGAAVGVTFATGLPAPVGRFAAKEVNGLLADTFRGKLEIVSLAKLYPDGLDDGAVRLKDADGRTVAFVHGVRARVSLAALVASLVGGGPLRVKVTELSIGSVDVLLAQAADGSLSIAQAFQPAKEEPPPPPTKSRGLDLSLVNAKLAHAWVHGAIGGLSTLDANLDDLAATFETTPDRTTVSLKHLRVSTRAMPKNADIGALVQGELSIPTDPSAMRASASVAGTVGGIGVRAEGTLDGAQVDATVDVPQVVPSQLDYLLGEPTLHQAASAHVEAHGALPHLDPRVHLAVGDGTIDVGGHVTLPSEGQSDTLARLTVAARNLDLRAAAVSAPASKLSFDLETMARLSAEGAVNGTYDLSVLRGVVAAQAIPSAHVAGAFSPTHVRGAGHVAEPGAPVDLRFDVDTVAKDGPDVAFDLKVDAQALSRIPQLGGAVRGHGQAHLDGRLALGAKRVDARLDASVASLEAGAVGADQVVLSAAATGPLDAPKATITVDGSGLRAAGYAYPRFHVAADGDPSEVRLGAELRGGESPAVTAKAVVGARGALFARDVDVTLSRGKDQVVARVAELRSAGDRLDVRGIRVEGAGAPLDGELHLRHGAIRARASTAGLDVPELLRVAGIQSDLRAGNVGLDVDLDATRRTTLGHANVTVKGVTYGDEVRALDARLAAAFVGDQLDLHLAAHDALNGTVAIDSENGHVGAGLLDPRAWTTLSGRAHVTANVDLHHANEVAHGMLPFDELAGWLTARIDVARDDAKHRPSLALDLATRGLSVTSEPRTVPNGDGTVAIVGRTFHSDGLDLHAVAHVDSESGKTDVDARVLDAKAAPVAVADVATTLPMPALLAGGGGESLLATKLRAHLDVPIRDVRTIPALLAVMPVRGQLGFTIDAEGNASEPHVRAIVHGRDVHDAEDPTPVPVSFDAAALYDGDVVRTKVVATHDGAQVLDANADVRMRAADLVAGRAHWNADADVKIAKFPIGSVTAYADENRIDGDLSGNVTLRGLHSAGALDANLALSGVDINGAKLGDTKVSAKLHDGSLEAGVQVAQTDGSADARVTGSVVWGADVAPSLDQAKPIDVHLGAKNFRIAMFAPFVRGSVNELDGRLNADTKLHVLPGAKDGTMTGAILLDHGRFDVPDAGGELHDARARIYMKPWGVWNVAEISADGTTGHFTANAVARVNGLSFKSGEAHLKIAEKGKLPIAMQGMELGTVWGHIDATGTVGDDGKKIAVDVKVPELHIALPQSIAHGVQSTDPDPTVKVGTIGPDGVVQILPVDGALPPPAPPQPVTASSPPTRIHVTTHLGPDLEIRRDTTVRAFVAEGPTIDIGKETKISGGISIPRGYIELQGKRFQIEKGKVTFTGQPVDDPVVVATASYEAPDGTKVFADFVGPVKTGKLTLRSEPDLSQNEILALLLFGTADGTFGQAAPQGQQGNDMTQAASLAGGVVTQGLNKAISGVSGVDVQTKVDTEETGDPRPEVEVALSREVSATLVYNLGVPPPGQNPDDTLLVLDWRFDKSYATEATLGDKGTSILDLTWKYRY